MPRRASILTWYFPDILERLKFLSFYVHAVATSRGMGRPMEKTKKGLNFSKNGQKKPKKGLNFTEN